MTDIKHTTLADIIESERAMAFGAEARYGEFFTNAAALMAFFSSFLKSINHDRYVFAMFLAQARKHYTLAILSTVRLHHTQALMDLRQVLEAGSCAAYAIANVDPADFADVDKQGLLNPSQELTRKRYRWLEKKFPHGSAGIKGMKEAINASASHANIVSAHYNFKIGDDWRGFETPFFDVEDKYSVRTDLWQCANIALGLIDLFYGVGQKYGGIVFAEDFLLRFQALEAVNRKHKEEMVATERYKKAAAKAEMKASR